MTATFHVDPHEGKPFDAAALVDSILEHRSEIAGAAHAAWSVVAIKKAMKAANEGKTGQAVAWGLYAGYATISSALNVGAAIVEHTSDSPQEHPIVKARDIFNPALKSREPENPVENLMRSIEALHRLQSDLTR